MPLYGVIHDSPIIAAGQTAVRKLKRKDARRQADVDRLLRTLAPILNKIQAAINEAEEDKKK